MRGTQRIDRAGLRECGSSRTRLYSPPVLDFFERPLRVGSCQSNSDRLDGRTRPISGRHRNLSLFRFLQRASKVPTIIARPITSPMKRNIAALVPRDHIFNPQRERGERLLIDTLHLRGCNVSVAVSLPQFICSFDFDAMAKE